MKITTIPTGFAIEFPFALKDVFRSAFPSSKWNAGAKRWEVGSRSGKRLEQWVVEAQGAANAAEELDQKSFEEKELENLRTDLAKIEETTKRQISRHADSVERAEAMAKVSAEIKAATEKLNAVRADVKAAEKAEVDEKQSIDDLLTGVIDIRGIKAHADIMARNMIPSNRQAKERFEEANCFIRKQREALVAAGWRCTAIEKLATANVNRPDRDHPRNVLDSDWYELRAVVAE